MPRRILHVSGTHQVEELEDEGLPYNPAALVVQAVLCGVCRSDIAMYAGDVQALPPGHFGHEGIGRVVEVGEAVEGDIQVGEYVATCADGAFSDLYHAYPGQWAKIPEPDPCYIVEPIACALNIFHQSLRERSAGDKKHTLIVGTGIIAWTVAAMWQHWDKESFEAVVIRGNHNIEQWAKLGKKPASDLRHVPGMPSSYGTIINLSSSVDSFRESHSLIEQGGLMCIGAALETNISTNFWRQSWNALTYIFPSPRNYSFHEHIHNAVSVVQAKVLDPSWFWTKSYDRNDPCAVVAAFEDGLNRDKDYVRGYLRW